MAVQSDFASYTSRDLHGHKKKILTASWSNNGKRLATGGYDNFIKIWRIDPRPTTRSERAESELAGLTGHVTQIEWDPVNTDRLFSVGDKSVRVWDTRTSRCLHTTKLSRDILHAAWRPDGAEIAVLDRTDTLTVIDSSTFKVKRAFKYQTESNEIAFSADSTLIYIATVNGAIDVVQYDTFKRLRSIGLHSNSTVRVKSSPDGRMLATGGTDAGVSLIETSECVCLHTIPGLDNVVSLLSFSSDSQWIAFSEEGSSEVCIASVATGKSVHKIASAPGNVIEALSWNPRHSMLAYNYCHGTDREGATYCYVGIFAAPDIVSSTRR